MRYSSNSRIAFSKLLRACAEDVVTGSLMDAFFCAGWAEFDVVPADAAKDENSSR